MSSQKIAIESLSMDLLRVADGYYRGSKKMADRFKDEALKRTSEIEKSKVEKYFANILNLIPKDLNGSNKKSVAEDALMYSIICKNYAENFS